MRNIIMMAELKMLTVQNIAMPRGSSIISIQNVEGKLMLYAMCDKDATFASRAIEMYNVGQSFRPLEPDQNRVYIATTQAVGMTFHLFEISNK